MQLPEGVYPSFLAALPENIRQEVLQEHLGIRHATHPPSGAVPPAAPSSSQGEPASASLSQVNPEFLAALPPHIQEEVSVISEYPLILSSPNLVSNICIKCF